MKVKNLIVVVTTILFALTAPLSAIAAEESSRTEPVSLFSAWDGPSSGSLFAAVGRPSPDAETSGQAAAVYVPPPGYAFQIDPAFKPAARFHFESAAFTSSLFTLAALNVADYLSTREALKYPGVAEGNPVMSLVVKNAWAFAAVKLATTAYLSYSLKKMHGRNKTTAWVMTLVANAVYSWVVYNNLSVIDKVRSR